ncbi:MAG: hypothetical protein KGO05_14215, partial [Chloroflexota bacterium]|nr:hypothetical protein [Chloroflexota bacterium]
MPGDYPPRDQDSARFRRPGESRFGQSQPPGPRPGASGAWGRPPAGNPGRSSGSNVYRPYSSGAHTAMPPGGPRVSGQWAAADRFGASAPGAGLTSAHMEAIHRKRLGFALFHDGNVGHLWRGEVMSLVGEGALSVGVIIWLVGLTGSPYVVLAALVALGFPLLLVAPFGATFENVAEPGRLLTWVGRVR